MEQVNPSEKEIAPQKATFEKQKVVEKIAEKKVVKTVAQMNKDEREKYYNEFIDKEAAERLLAVKESGQMWVTIVDPNRNFWNSADSAHFFVQQGHCKPLPDEITSIIENSISSHNPMLREANDIEILKEIKHIVTEELIAQGKIKPFVIEEKKMVF